MVPIDYNAFWSSFTPKNGHVGDVSRTRGGTVYYWLFRKMFVIETIESNLLEYFKSQVDRVS